MQLVTLNGHHIHLLVTYHLSFKYYIVFAAVTSNGNLYVYDLKQEKHHHLCEHPAMKKAKALHVSFNKEDPIILVGDERGGVNSFKLSKSLTKGPMVPIKEEDQGKSSIELEC